MYWREKLVFQWQSSAVKKQFEEATWAGKLTSKICQFDRDLIE